MPGFESLILRLINIIENRRSSQSRCPRVMTMDQKRHKGTKQSTFDIDSSKPVDEPIYWYTN